MSQGSVRKSDLRSLGRGLEIMLMFVEEDNTARTVRDVMALLDVPRSTAYRFIKVLRDRGFLQDASGRGTFELGPQISVLAAGLENRFDLSRVAMPVLHEIVERTSETAFVTVRSGGSVICLDLVASPQSIRVYYRKGRRLPLHAGASPKVVLAHLPKKEQERVLAGPLEAVTDLTITDPEALRRTLDEIHEQGYCVSRGEIDPDVYAVSVPVFRPSGKFLCGLSAAGPAYRLSEKTIGEFLAVIQDASRKLTEEIARFEVRPVRARRSTNVLEMSRQAG
jgi:DNA-binding IclR family transcriptional regulator